MPIKVFPIFFISVISLLLINTLIYSQVDGNNVYRFHNKEKGYSIELPKTWQEQDNQSADTVKFLAPKDNDADQFRLVLEITAKPLENNMVLEEACNVKMMNLSNQLNNYMGIGDDVLLIDNVEAHWFAYKYNVSGKELVDLDYIIVKDNMEYSVRFTSKFAGFDSLKASLDKTAQSFKFDKK